MAIDLKIAEAALAKARRRTANLRFFYSQLSTPDWIEPLRKLGVFSTPLPAIKESGTISFPEWPESSYLVRMVPLAPESVQKVILEIPSTDNLTIHQDFVVAATSMPATLAAPIASRETKWIESGAGLFGLYPEKVGKLISHLSAGGETKVAAKLASALLSISAEERDADNESPFPDEPNARFDPWHYGRVIESAIVNLADYDRFEALKIVSRNLARALEIHGSKYEDKTEDYSWIWRPNVAHDHLHDLKETLVNAVRDVALRIANRSHEDLAFVSEELGRYPWRMFRRIRMYIVATSSQSGIEDAAPFLEDKSNYESTEVNAEFQLVLKRFFPVANERIQSFIRQVVREGPDLHRWKKNYEEFFGQQLNPEDLQRKGQVWRAQWLKLLPDIPQAWKSEFETALALTVEIEEDASRTGVFVGPTSPRGAEDLSSMSVPQLIDYLNAFVPSGDWAAPTTAGLGNELMAAVTNDPGKYADEATRFVGLEATYVRSLFEGLREGQKKQKISMVPALELAKWVIDQKRDSGNRGFEDSDPNWGWCRKAIASFLGESVGRNLLPSNAVARAFNILAELADDLDPDITRNSTNPAEHSFAGMLGLNSVRGAALDALIKLAYWHRPQKSGVLAILERHLDLSFDSSYVVREVVGHLVPLLHQIDNDWPKDNLSRIFPAEFPDHREVAWHNYVIFNRPYNDMVPLLRGEYAAAICRVGSGKNRARENADEALAQHLMTFVWRGVLTISDELVKDFYSRSIGKIGSVALTFIGRSLTAEPQQRLEPEVVKRLMHFWQWRFNTSTTPETELSSFGWWIPSPDLEQEWLLTQALGVIEKAGRLDPDFVVVKDLARFFEKFPEKTIEVLYQIIRVDRDNWSVYGWKDEANDLLARALSNSLPAVRLRGKQTVDLLVAKGHFDFAALLSK